MIDYSENVSDERGAEVASGAVLFDNPDVGDFLADCLAGCSFKVAEVDESEKPHDPHDSEYTT